MRNPVSQLLALGPELVAFILTLPLSSAAQQTVSLPALNLKDLGRVAIGGDFDSVSLYTYQGQNEDSYNTNGSQALLSQYPDGTFQSVAMADAFIMSMCSIQGPAANMTGVVVGGNFTSLGGISAQGLALYDPNTTRVTAWNGLNGKVNAVYCDQSSSTVYVGGLFTGGNSSNAMSYTTGGWVNLPFAGLNGEVTSITKNSAGNIVFAGNFDGLGNTTTPHKRDGQVINLGSGNITSSGGSLTPGFDDPSSIICKTAAQDGSNNTWLLADNLAGYWAGNYSFGFNPTKLRLYQTQQPNRGTKTWYFQDMSSGGINNMTYVDNNGQNASCSSSCPLPQSNSTYQDFHFEPSVGMNAFKIYITDWYGDGAGLDGIELFQDDIYSFAVNDFNEPKCDDVSSGSSSTLSPASGTWTRMPADNTSSEYMSASLTDSSQVGPNVSVVFTPDIKQSGNYSITVYTPGCLQDNTCSTRGMVNITGSMTSNSAPVTTTLFQTNNYDKYDQVYYGYVDVDTDSFKPSVTLTPQAGQNVPLTVVAQRVRFELVTTTGGLNGLFEYNPNLVVVSDNFTTSAIDSAGAGLNSGATINRVVEIGSTLYAAGNFTGNGISNVMAVGENATALANGGLNADVAALYANGTLLYMGGNFTNTADNSVSGLNNVAIYDTSSNKWSAMGAGVNGSVCELVPITLNVTGTTDTEECLTVNGDFTSVNGFGSNSAFNAQGFAIWVPSRSNWLNNIPGGDQSVSGKLITYTTVPGNGTLYAGQITSQGLGYSGAFEMTTSGGLQLQSMGINVQAINGSNSSSTLSKRDTSANSSSYSGVYQGMFYNQSGLDIAILGGNFAATASNGSTMENLLFINDTSTRMLTGVSGLDSSSTFMAMGYYQTTLYAGGSVSGKVNGNSVNGLIVYDLAASNYAATQPPALAGTNVVVYAIAVQPSSPNVYVGGSFSSAGSLPCETLCYYDASTLQWNTPGAGLTGTITQMVWSSNDELIIAGNLTVGGNATTMVSYDAKKEVFSEFTGASALPGPITALAPADSSYDQFWAAGLATNNGSSYLSKYDNNAWTAVSGLEAGTEIRGLQVLMLSDNHDSADLMPNNEVLMLTGSINVANFGNASAALFNGTTFQPFILTNRNDGSQGTLSRLFVENSSNLMSKSGHHLALGLVVLVGLAISLALIFLIVVTGICIERQRRRKEGYVPMQMDKNGNLSRIPPETLLGGLGEKDDAPKL
jgi:hypothetical protein